MIYYPKVCTDDCLSPTPGDRESECERDREDRELSATTCLHPLHPFELMT